MKNTIKNLAMLIALATAEVLLLHLLLLLYPVELLTEPLIRLWEKLNWKRNQTVETIR